MNIKMSKNQDNIDIILVDKEGVERSFDYVSMIRLLYSEKKITDTEYVGEFSADEQTNLDTMISKISEILLPE